MLGVPVTLTDYLGILRRRWPWVLMPMILGGFLGWGFAEWTTPQYSSMSQIFVSSSDGGASGDLYQGSLFTQQRVKSYAEIIDSPEILGPAAAEVGGGATSDTIAEQISASVPLDTVLINLTATDASPERAAEIANAVADQFVATVPKLENPTGSERARVYVTVVRPGEVPTQPVSPIVWLFTLLGLMAGAVVGVVLALSRHLRDTRIRTYLEVHGIIPAPLLGELPPGPRRKNERVVLDRFSARAEAFRSLRTNLQYLDVDEPHRVVVITSSTLDEGRTVTATNLAITMAEARRTVLIDADLRSPQVASDLGLQNDLGLTSVLIGNASIEDAMQSWGPDGLCVLTSGPVPPNPSELLSSRQMRDLLQTLYKQFEVIVLDAPPLLSVTDAAIVAKVTGGAIIVVRSGKTRREQLVRAIDALRTVEAPILGVVMTDVALKVTGRADGQYGTPKKRGSK